MSDIQLLLYVLHELRMGRITAVQAMEALQAGSCAERRSVNEP